MGRVRTAAGPRAIFGRFKLKSSPWMNYNKTAERRRVPARYGRRRRHRCALAAAININKPPPLLSPLVPLAANGCDHDNRRRRLHLALSRLPAQVLLLLLAAVLPRPSVGPSLSVSPRTEIARRRQRRLNFAEIWPQPPRIVNRPAERARLSSPAAAAGQVSRGPRSQLQTGSFGSRPK